MIRQLISGGQTGVQRAALDAALAQEFPCGGWCPKGRRTEDGPLPARYPLQETDSPGYTKRTIQNVRDSDGTLIITRGAPTGRTESSLQSARKQGKPVLVIDLDAMPSAAAAADKILTWADRRFIRHPNVTGPRESRCPGIYAEALALLTGVLTQLKG